ncbi:MAG: hypothetical protein ABFD96_19280, partial [Armatimonadia bacterium]
NQPHERAILALTNLAEIIVDRARAAFRDSILEESQEGGCNEPRRGQIIAEYGRRHAEIRAAIAWVKEQRG